MTATQKYLPPFESHKSFSSTQSGGFKNFFFNRGNSSTSDRKILKFSPSKFSEEIEKLEWRKKTEFPIIKIIDYKPHNNIFSNNSKYSSKKFLI